MTWLVTIGLTNAVLAAMLALVAWAVGRWAKRPALTHVLWVLALIKLLTPPVFEVPIGWRIDPAVFEERSEPVFASLPQAAPTVALAPVAAPAEAPPIAVAPPAVRAESRIVQLPAPQPVAIAAPLTSSQLARLAFSPLLWLRGALIFWVVGSLWMAALFISRMRRFRRYLNIAGRTDPELSARLAELARSAKLPACPRVTSVESTISPMLFGLGRGVTLIFPAALSRQLAPAARDTLLLHELAHYARGDHWVRLVELLAQVIFWWHPVVWWARHELEAAEEECCDAWVVERHAGVPRLYAEALLATIDFLCAEPMPLPPAACGLGDVPFLRARLTQIVRGRLAMQLSPAAKTAVFLGAVFVLPFGPALFGASVAPIGSDSATAADIAPAVEVVEEPAISLPQPTMPAAPPVVTGSDSPTVMAIAALARPARLPELWATAYSPDQARQFRLEARTGYQVTLVGPNPPRLAFISDPLVKCAAFKPGDGQTFATGHDSSEVKIYESPTGGQTKTLKGAPAAICSVAFSPDGMRVAAGSADGSVTVWDVASGDSSAIAGPRGVPVSCVRWSPDGKRLAIAHGDFQERDDATLLICDARDGSIRAQYGLANPAGAVEWMQNGEALLIADWSGATAVWQLSDGLVLAQGTLDRKAVSAANWSPDCPRLADQLQTQVAP